MTISRFVAQCLLVVAPEPDLGLTTAVRDRAGQADPQQEQQRIGCQLGRTQVGGQLQLSDQGKECVHHTINFTSTGVVFVCASTPRLFTKPVVGAQDFSFEFKRDVQPGEIKVTQHIPNHKWEVLPSPLVQVRHCSHSLVWQPLADLLIS
jgi:hypothetical protein